MQNHPENTWDAIDRDTIDGTIIKNEFSACGSNRTCIIELDTASTQASGWYCFSSLHGAEGKVDGRGITLTHLISVIFYSLTLIREYRSSSRVWQCAPVECIITSGHVLVCCQHHYYCRVFYVIQSVNFLYTLYSFTYILLWNSN